MQRFGRSDEGVEVHAFSLGSDGGLQAEILTLGGTLKSLTLPVKGRRIPLILSLPDIRAYQRDTLYIGQIVGRYCNRIAGAEFELDGKTHKLTANGGAHALHGGEKGFGKFIWDAEPVRGSPNDALLLRHRSPDGMNGFPGNLDVSAIFCVAGNTLSLRVEAITDAPTPISITWHPYLNLSGDPNTPIDEHRLTIAADHYLPVTEARIPTGEIASLAATPLDFRQPRALTLPVRSSRQQAELVDNFDHCYVLNRDAEVAAVLYSPSSGVSMRLRTNLPGLQLYGGYHLPQCYPGWHALSLEPQNFPDAPNQPSFPTSILRPGEVHRSFMSYEFFVAS